MNLYSYRLIAPAGLFLLGIDNAAIAQNNYFPGNATINYAITNSAIIGYATLSAFTNGTGGTSPTVSFVSGASTGGYLYAGNGSTVNVSGGNIGSYLYAFATSTVNVSGGNIDNSVIGSAYSLVNLAGGTVEDEVYASNNSTVNVNSGSIGDSLFAQDSSTVNVRGGSISGSLYATDSGILNLFGTGLGSTLVNSNYQNAYSQYILSGNLQDGTSVSGTNLYVQNGTGAEVNFIAAGVPEANSLALLGWLGLTGAALLRRQRSR
jgi:hypothetical protein